MNNLEKLIKDGGWRPIEKAPKDGDTVLVYQPYFGDENTVARHRKTREEYTCTAFYDASRNGWFEFQSGDGYEYQENQVYPTKFMPLDTPERMAKVIEVLANGLEWVVGYEGNQHTTTKAKESLQKANKIAGE